LWGGRTFLGIDCSGFTQLVYKLNGVQLPRDAYQQAELGEFVVFLDQAKVGDLAFFVNDADKVTHVGLLLGDGKVIHASGKVRIDKIDSHGIFDEKQGKHTHILKCIKRIL
jgi:cell wall-associated NlpC family hydrolase